MKDTTGYVDPARPEPDPEQMAQDALLTSMYAGLGLVVAVVVYGVFGGVALKLATGASRTVAMTAFGIGLAIGLVVLVLVMRQNGEQMRTRNRNMYRGAWIGIIGALVIMVLMYYLPWIAFPAYCPPGAFCT